MEKRSSRPRVAIDCLGCKLNQAEVQQLAGELSRAGYEIVGPDDGPDIYILNTCTVTHIADRKARHLLRMFHRRNPAARLVAIGCYAERAAADLKQLEGVDLVLGNREKWELPARLLELVQPATADVVLPPVMRRTRAFVRVQDGCRNFCAYCIVPLVRREETSVPVEEVIDRINTLCSEGYREVVVTGTEIGTYYSGGAGLQVLLKHILAETSIDRLRLSSLQPLEIVPDLIDLWRDPRLCPHFHLSVQSGSDSVLRRMKRRYSVPDYRRAVSLIRDIVPDVAITTDVIVGFPGESDTGFRESLEFCLKMEFARIHVFPYSPRPGTAAAVMPGQVPELVKKARSREMLALAKESALGFRRRFVGRTLEVLFEQSSAGIWSGYTGNYVKVYIKSERDLGNCLVPVKLIKTYKDGVWGEV
jgi:threonylcarbamoyladenosine tRNA methylthiotransferase MtaB